MPTTPTPVPQRRGIASQVIFIPETAWNNDPGSPLPFLAPLADKASYATDQGLEDAPIYKGLALPPQQVDTNYTSGGGIPMAQEFVTIGRFLKLFVGANGYIHPDTTGRAHFFQVPITVGSLPTPTQVVRKYNEATIQYFRSKGNYINSFHWPFQTAGRATYDLDLMGSGLEVYTNLGGAPTDDGYYVPASYFNMQMVVNNIVSIGLTNFDDTVSANLSRQEVGANNGVAGSVNAGFYSAKGNLGTIYATDGSGIEANNYLTNLALNDTEFAIDCVYFDLPNNTATKWFRRRYWVRLSYPKIMPGGAAGVTQEAEWRAVGSSNALWAAERIGDNLGPIALTAGAQNLGVKIDGGGTVTVSVGTTSQTIDQIVTTLNAAGAFNAVAIADNYLGHLRITSKQITLKGVASSVAIDTSVATSAHSLLGFSTNTVYNGFGSINAPAPIIYEVNNGFGAAY